MAATTTLSRPTRRLAGLRTLLGDNPALVPALAVVAMLIALAASEAGFYPINSRRHPGLGWYPAAVLALALLVAAAAAVRPRMPSRPVLAALSLFAGYTAWSFLSIGWAEQQGVAWDGANRTALYLLIFALFALWPVTTSGASILLGALGLGLAGLGLVELLRADAAADPVVFFVDARFVEPAGYINANVAMWTLGLFLCLYLATSRDVNALLRGLGLGGAGVLACLSLLGQSRGWVLALPVAALLFVALTPHRARALAALAATALGTLAVSGSLLAPHDRFTPESFDGLLAEATRDILALGAVLTAVGLLAALADRRVSVSARRSRTANRVAVAALALALAIGGVAVVAKVGDPIEKASDAWRSFTNGDPSTSAGASRFNTAGTNRYDFWVVAWDRFRDRPLTGIGSENFQADYLARGTSSEQPRYPHSLQLGVLSQTGLVGALLLGGAVAAALFAALRRRRRGDLGAAAAIGAAGTVFGYWFLHASIDWFWEFPALTGIAFAALGLGCAVGRPPGEERNTRVTRIPPVARLVTSALAVILLLVSFSLPWLAEREVEKAASRWPSSPAGAFERLHRAEALNPLSPKPHLVAGTIAIRVEDQERATAEFEEVLRLEPRTPFALAELAALASERGQSERAERLLDRASGYAPNDGVVGGALDRVRSGRSIDIRELNAGFLDIARGRTGTEDPGRE